MGNEDDKNNSQIDVNELGLKTLPPDSPIMGNEDDKISVDELGLKTLPPESINALEEVNITYLSYTSVGSFREFIFLRSKRKGVWGVWGVIAAVLLLLGTLLFPRFAPVLRDLF